MVDADVCASKLQEWCQKGSNMLLLDLREACLQVWVNKTVWPFQMVVFHDKKYCLTKLDFSLNVSAMLSREESPWGHLHKQRCQPSVAHLCKICSLIWIARIQSGLKIEWAYWAWTSAGERHPAMEMGKCGSGHSWSSHKVVYFFTVQKTCRAPASVWLASRSSGRNKMQGECSNLMMGQSNEWFPPHLNDYRKWWKCNTRRPLGEWCINREEMNIWVNAQHINLSWMPWWKVST